MDSLIATLTAWPDGDLMLTANGVAYQADMAVAVDYDEAYWSKCAAYEGTPIGDAIVAGRVAFVRRHHAGPLLDIGIGSGAFIRAYGPEASGFDINPRALAWLREAERYSEDFALGACTLWDVLEHLPRPRDYLQRMPVGTHLFVSVPIFDDLSRIRESKHYRPGEHLYYWTARGLRAWMHVQGWDLLEESMFETEAGRDSIASFAWRRLWR